MCFNNVVSELFNHILVLSEHLFN